MKQANMAIRRLRTREVGDLNSCHTNTPHKAETMVAPCPIEYEIAGPTKWTRDAARLSMAPVTQIAPPKAPARCQPPGAAKYCEKVTGEPPSIGFLMKRVLRMSEESAVPTTKNSAVAYGPGASGTAMALLTRG